MKKINNYQELSKLIFSNLKKDVMTNTFISKEEFEEEINQGNLYYIFFKQGLFILRDRGDYYILNYYLSNIEKFELCLEQFDKSIVVEIVGKNDEDTKYIKAINLFKSLDLQLEIKRERYIKKQNVESTINEKNVNNVKNEDINISFCEISDFESIRNILIENFNKYYGCIPSNDVLKKDILSKSIYKATINNKIVGILHFKQTDKVSEIRHLAVDEKNRNKGVASKLLSHYDGNSFSNKVVWTGKENINAQKVYKNNGYIRDGYVSSVLIKKI